jgi:predicted aconitase with swiveling domain
MGVNGIRTIRGRPVVPGKAAGEAVVCRASFMFAHGVDPQTGVVTDVRSDVFGRSIKGKVLVFPFGKGSTTGSAWFLEAARQGNGPAAVLNQETEPVVVTGALLAKLVYSRAIPLVDRLDPGDLAEIEDGDIVEVDGSTGRVRIGMAQPGKGS